MHKKMKLIKSDERGTLVSDKDIRQYLNDMSAEKEIALIIFTSQYTNSVETAKDCVYLAYIQALENAERIKNPDRIDAWLRTVAKRNAYKVLHSSYRNRKLIATLQLKQPIDEMDHMVMRIVLNDALAKVLSSYPPWYSNMIHMHYTQQVPLKEISRILHLSYAAVRKAHQRVLVSLREEMGLTMHRNKSSL